MWITEHNPAFSVMWWLAVVIGVPAALYAIRSMLTIAAIVGVLYLIFLAIGHILKTETSSEQAQIINTVPTNTPIPQKTYQAPETLYVNTQQMKLRSGPGVQNSEIGRVSFGDAVVVTEYTTNADGGSWVKVTTESLSGWLNKKYLSTNPDLEKLNDICTNIDSEKLDIFKEIVRDNFDLVGPTSAREGGVCNVINNMEIDKKDLNADGQPELIVYPGFGCGAQNCDIPIFQITNKGYKVLLSGNGVGADVKEASSNGYSDIEVTAHDSSTSYIVHTYKYGGGKYKDKQCWAYQQLENGTKTRSQCSTEVDAPPVHATTQSPSFNCDKAKTNVEIIICNDPDLRGMDMEMAELYRSHKNGLPSDIAKKLINTQKSWLSTRNSCGNNLECLHTVYQERIMWLKEYEPYN